MTLSEVLANPRYWTAATSMAPMLEQPAACKTAD